MRGKLGSAPASQRPAILRELARRTKWGTPERYAFVYVCAWYGVDYATCIRYLTNVARWWELGFEDAYRKKWHVERYNDSTGTYTPFSYLEEDHVLLYELYQHNRDFQLLHDILTTRSDGAGAEVIMSLTADCIEKHPRGMLHVACISSKGHDLAVDLLTGKDDSSAFISMMDTLPACWFSGHTLKRVAADAKDPLGPLAKELLEWELVKDTAPAKRR